MSRGDLHIRLWDRPVKPLAVGVIIALIAVVLNGGSNAICGKALIGPTEDDIAIGVIASIALFLIIFSWLYNRQFLFELGLLFCAGTFVARTVLMLLLVGAYPLDFLLPLSVAVLSGGAFILERIDDAPDGRLR
jgi:hypothetical protein